MAKSITSSATTLGRKKIFIVDDHPMMREGLREVINREPDLLVCGEAGTAHQAMESVQKLKPDLMLVDITLPGKNGLELVKDLKVLYPQLPVLAISMHDESLYAERMLRAGASGFIAKHQPSEELVKAIRQVLANQIYASLELSEKILRRFSGKAVENQSAMAMLTDREFEVFQLVGEGKSAKEIAKRLCLSDKTVSVHTSNIRKKLQLKNTGQMIRLAVQWEDSNSPGK